MMNFQSKGFTPKPLDLKRRNYSKTEGNFGLRHFPLPTAFENKSTSFILGINSSQNSDCEVLSFKDVIDALSNSSKGKLQYPEPFIEDLNELCDLKHIGDLKQSSFSSYNTFRERQSLSDDDESESENDINGKNSDDECDFGLNRTEDNVVDNNDDDFDTEVLNLQLLISDIKLRQERTVTKQMHILHHHDEYICKLDEIRQNASLDLEKERKRENERREEEIERLVQLEQAATHQALIAEEEYRRQSELREMEMIKEIETLKNKEVERQLSIEKLRQDVEQKYNEFRYAWDGVKEGIKNYTELSIEPCVDNHLQSVCAFVDNSLSLGEGSNEEELEEGRKSIMDAIQIINTLSAFIDERKAQDLRVKQAEHVPSQPIVEAQPRVTSEIVDKPPEGLNKHLAKLLDKYLKAKEKSDLLSQVSIKIKEKINMRPLLARAIGIVNRLSNQNFDSSNRGSLQQIMNLLAGRTCSVGEMSVSIQNDTIAEAFVIEQISTNLISLSHDKQVGTLPIYASFIMKIWQHFPHVGELILYKLFETCPFLVPLAIKKKENQSEAEYNRSLGFRHKEGGTQEAVDKYLNRMGACARLYGRIVSMELENHPHGIENGWVLIATIVSLPPMPSITTSILNGFLSIAGNALINAYGRQFRKILHFICTDYLSLIKNDTLEGGDSDVHSLTKLLENYLKTGTIPPPKEGYRPLI